MLQQEYQQQGVLVLIDGHPQYMGLMGHPISDAYQSLLAERVEVLRGPASVLYQVECDGGDQYCNPEDATGWSPDTCKREVRFL